MENDMFLELCKERFSVRKFTEEKVDEAKILKILKAGQLAPTACNLQPQKILVINNEEALEKVRKCTMSHFDCTLAFLVSYDQNKCWVRDYDDQKSGEVDASIVATQMMLEAHAIGVGCTWVMHFIPEAVKEEFNLPESFIPVCLLVMGYPAEDAKPFPSHSKRKELEKMVVFNQY